MNAKTCKHGVGFDRDKGGKLPVCHHCKLIWHEGCLASAEASVVRHKAKVKEALAAISRTCGDA